MALADWNPRARKRAAAYVLIAVALVVTFFVVDRIPWQSNDEVHTVLESVATILALFVAMVALVRYHSRPNELYLYFGAAFLGAALLDGYHVILSSAYFAHRTSLAVAPFPSPLDTLAAWSWLVARLFLAILLWQSINSTTRPVPHVEGGAHDRRLLTSVALLAVFACITVVFVPLPAYWTRTGTLTRPAEALPAAFFLFALFGALRRGVWKDDDFEHWLVVGLICSVFTHVPFMARASGLSTSLFDFAHILKVASYGCVLTGLVLSMDTLFRKADESGRVLAASNAALNREIAERRQAERDLAEAYQRLADSREAERLHLARELHDVPLQDLYGVRLRLGQLAEVLPEGVGHGALAEVQDALQGIIDRLRIICNEMRPPALAPFGLEVAIRSHAERFSAAHPELDLTLQLEPDKRRLPERTRLALFRIYQQALDNVAHHAEATHLQVDLALEDDQVTLSVGDDGRGFEVPARWLKLARRGHLGLLGASERADAIGGRLEVSSTIGEGTVLRVIAPITDAESGPGWEAAGEAGEELHPGSDGPRQAMEAS